MLVPMPSSSSAIEELQILRPFQDQIDGGETRAARPGDAAEEWSREYVVMRSLLLTSPTCLLAHIGNSFLATFPVGVQKCEFGFRVEVMTSQGNLRFWDRPEWDLHRIRHFLAQCIGGDVAAMNRVPSSKPPAHVVLA